MAEYAKKTVAELTEILKSRGLPHTGKKADLIARLNENDKEAESEAADPAAAEPAPAVPEPTVGEAEEEQAQPEAPSMSEAPAPASVAAVDGPAETETETTEAMYTLNLKASDLDSELAKRKARAERFGTGAATTAPTNDESADANTESGDAEALKNLERAKRFGTGNTAISKLDEALPTERLRGNKRKAAADETTTSLEDPGLRKGFASRGRGGGGSRGGRFRGQGGNGNRTGGANPRGPQGVTKASAFSSDKDRLAAEARKKKFATA